MGTVVAVLCEEASDVGKFESYSPATEGAAAPETGGDLPAPSETSPSDSSPSLSSLALPPHTVLGMPSLSPTMTQGSLSSWKKKEGEAIEAGEILAEVETDKATIEWEAVEGGFLAKILVQDGATDVEIGRPVAIVCDEEEDLGAFSEVTLDMVLSGDQQGQAPAKDKEEGAPSAPAPRPDAEAIQAQPRARRSGSHVAASPLAKSIAASEGLADISPIQGTGPGGRIIAADVREYLESRPALAASSATALGGADFAAAGALGSAYEDVPVTQMRAVIADRLLLSKQTIPHYYLTIDCEVGALMSLRSTINASSADATKVTKVSLNDFIVKALALACLDVPECNAEWREDAIRLHKTVNVGVAMDLGSLGHSQGGLVVPVVRAVDAKGLASISAAVKNLAARARPVDGVDGKMRLSPEDMDEGTFTVTNLGMMGVKQFAAIVNPPQSCILAVGAVRSEVKRDGSDDFREAKVMSVTLSCDHRVVDGAVGSKWLQKFKELIENPLQMLL